MNKLDNKRDHLEDSEISPADRRRSRQLQDFLRARGEFISFARFMKWTLTHPQWGYYTSKSRIFGRDGDFVTAPELSPLYSYTLAHHWCDLANTHRQRGLNFDVLELGAGRGQLALEVLRYMHRLGAPPRRYIIYEPSERLIGVQKEKLAQLNREGCESVELMWLSDYRDLRLQGVIFANEVFDTLPVEIARRHRQTVQQLHVGWDRGRDSWRSDWRSAPSSLERDLCRLESRLRIQFADDYLVEIHSVYPKMVAQLSEALQFGQIWVNDYGYDEPNYYHPERGHGTVQCYYRHQKHNDYLSLIGLQDLTASVNFDYLYTLMRQHGLDLVFYQSQSDWLGRSNTVEEWCATQLEDDDALGRQVRLQNIKRLMMPDAMGEVFKMLVLERPIPASR